MKPITFKQFVSLVQSADVVEFDTNEIDVHEFCEDHIILYWTVEECGIDENVRHKSVNIDDDKEFFFDSKKGQVKYKDSNGIEVVVNFYMKVPLTEIPRESGWTHRVVNAFTQQRMNVPSGTKCVVLQEYPDGFVRIDTIFGTFATDKNSIEEL
jgi:hypothetical protein